MKGVIVWQRIMNANGAIDLTVMVNVITILLT